GFECAAAKFENVAARATGKCQILPVFKWHQRLSQGRDSLEDDQRMGRPPTVRTNARSKMFHRCEVWQRRMVVVCLHPSQLTGPLPLVEKGDETTRVSQVQEQLPY
ncbi:hypothetical protein C0J52_11205, partial [Blattella germanica]